MRLFVSSDVHGYYDLWMKALEEKGFEKDNPNHAIALIGDLLDRGIQPRECLEFVNSLPDNRKILIKGNHEELMEDMLKRGFAYSNDYSNGTLYSVYDYLGTNLKECSQSEAFDCFANDPQWIKYINSCVDYWENDKVVFVHGWIPVYETGGSYGGKVFGPTYMEEWREGNWKKARWYNGMQIWDNGVRIPDKTIWCGHWHASWGHYHLHGKGSEWDDDYYEAKVKPNRKPRANFNPFEEVGIMAMDACTAYSGQVNVKVITIRKEDIKA